MSSVNASGDLSSKMEVDAFRHLFPLRFLEHYLLESIRPDAKKLGKARDTTLALGAIASADGSALAKIGCTTMLAAIKMEVMTPTTESPDEGCIVIDFHMPPICSLIVRPGRPADAALVISKQLSDTILRTYTIWMLMVLFFDAALLAAVAAFSHLQIPVVSLNDDGRVVVVSEEDGDPTAEEESIMETLVTVVLDSSFQLVSLYKPGGPVLAYTSAIQDCIALTQQGVKELQKVLNEAISEMEGY